jgi:hypothetical protein
MFIAAVQHIQAYVDTNNRTQMITLPHKDRNGHVFKADRARYRVPAHGIKWTIQHPFLMRVQSSITGEVDGGPIVALKFIGTAENSERIIEFENELYSIGDFISI